MKVHFFPFTWIYIGISNNNIQFLNMYTQYNMRILKEIKYNNIIYTYAKSKIYYNIITLKLMKRIFITYTILFVNY